MEKSIQTIEEKGFILSIKKLFNNIKFKLFGKKEIVLKEEKSIETSTVYTPNSFIDELKVESGKIDSRIEKQYFLKQLEGNVEMLNQLSIKRLRVLEEYYSEVIKRNEKKIRRVS